MPTLRLRIATTNVPESMKRGLIRDRVARAARVMGFYSLRRCDVIAVQESGDYLEAAETPTHKALWARWNQIVKGRHVGNGIVVNRRRWKSRLLEDVEVGGLHIPVVLVTERNVRGRAPFKFKMYGVHRPTRRAENAALRPVIDAVLREHIKRDDKAGRAWIVAGDMNVSHWNPVRGIVLASHRVDHIVGSRHFEPLGQRDPIRRPLLSDHAFLIADAVVEV